MIPPMFSYFGSKYRLSIRYAVPQYDTIIEPFAGAAGYSHRYYERNIILIEKNAVIANIWKYLIEATYNDIMRLPILEKGQSIHDFDIQQVEKDFIGFWLSKACTNPRRRLCNWVDREKVRKSVWSEWIRERVANNVSKIKHWRIIQGDYSEIDNIEACWFVDPPYQFVKGHQYKYHKLDYEALGNWCRNRNGQVIACEQEGATWLPFRRFAINSGLTRKTVESVWLNNDLFSTAADFK